MQTAPNDNVHAAAAAAAADDDEGPSGGGDEDLAPLDALMKAYFFPERPEVEQKTDKQEELLAKEQELYRKVAAFGHRGHRQPHANEQHVPRAAVAKMPPLATDRDHDHEDHGEEEDIGEHSQYSESSNSQHSQHSEHKSHATKRLKQAKEGRSFLKIDRDAGLVEASHSMAQAKLMMHDLLDVRRQHIDIERYNSYLKAVELGVATGPPPPAPWAAAAAAAQTEPTAAPSSTPHAQRKQ